SPLPGDGGISRPALFFVPYLIWRKSEAKPVRHRTKRSRNDYFGGEGSVMVIWQRICGLFRSVPALANSVESEITKILRAWHAGSEQALDKLTPEIYRELHRAAQQCMRNEREGHTLQTTALINELYLRLSDLQDIDWQGRAHFFAICAR